MAGTTANYGFSYPENSDPVNVAGDIQGLAEDIDSTLSTQLASTVKTTDSGTVTSTMIANGTIVNADINASAAIDQSKIANLSTDLAGKAALSGATFTGVLNAPYEPIISQTIVSNILNHSINDGNVIMLTTASANFTLNILNLPTTDNQTTTISVIITQGATGYIPSVLQIGGVGQTIKWQGGSAPTPTSSKTDIFSFTLTRIFSAWTVYGSMVGNF